MGSSTFSGAILSGKRGQEILGTAVLSATIPVDQAIEIGPLPKGITILSIIGANASGVGMTITNGTDTVTFAPAALTDDVSYDVNKYFDEANGAPVITIDDVGTGRMRIQYTRKYFHGED